MSRAAESTRRERTRDALREAALRRFVADGFEATSIADIAADVGVTPRTFYRYFASKDEVLFADYEARLDWFRRALSVRPRREPITTSVLAAIDSFPDDPQVVSEIARLRAGELDPRRIEPHIRRVQAELGREIEAHLLERARRGRDAGPTTRSSPASPPTPSPPRCSPRSTDGWPAPTTTSTSSPGSPRSPSRRSTTGSARRRPT